MLFRSGPPRWASCVSIRASTNPSCPATQEAAEDEAGVGDPPRLRAHLPHQSRAPRPTHAMPASGRKERGGQHQDLLPRFDGRSGRKSIADDSPGLPGLESRLPGVRYGFWRRRQEAPRGARRRHHQLLRPWPEPHESPATSLRHRTPFRYCLLAVLAIHARYSNHDFFYQSILS